MSMRPSVLAPMLLSLVAILPACSAAEAPGEEGESEPAGATPAAPGTSAPAPSASPEEPGTAGGSAPTGAPGGASAACAGATFCDGFEGAAGGGLDPSTWAIVTPNCKGTGTLAVDATVAHGGQRSIKVSGAGGYCNHVFLGTKLTPAAGTTLYGRFFVKLGTALGDAHVTFLALKDTSDGKDLRMGGQSKILMWNREQDDATLPELSPAGQAKSVKPTIDAWHCVELAIDGKTGGIQTWFDGGSVDGLVADGETTPDVDGQWRRRSAWTPRIADAKLGWESYGADANTVWFDDVAFGPARIGCGS